MLKVKSLNMIDGLTVEEKMAPGQVEITIGSADPIKGTAHFKRDGMNLVASVLAGGVITAENLKVNPEDITVKVTKKLVRDVKIAKGQSTLKLTKVMSEALADAAENIKLDGDDCTKSSGDITFTEATEDKVAKLEFTAEVAEAAAEDSDLKAADGEKLLLVEQGPIHFSMICEAEHHPCSKHSKTRCTVRGRKPWKVTGEDGPIHLAPVE